MRANKENILYSVIQSAYWMIMCVANTFAIVFLQSRGYNNSNAGLIIALGNIFGFILSSYMAELIDKSEKCTAFTMLPITILLQAFSLVAIAFVPGKNLVVTCCYIINMAALLARYPLLVQLFVDLRGNKINVNFGLARGLGSLFFLGSSLLLGNVVYNFSAELLIQISFILVLIQSISINCLKRCVNLTCCKLAVSSTEKASTTIEFIKRNPRFFFMLIGGVLIFFGQNNLYNYTINICRYLGGTEKTMGFMNALMAAYEIPFLLFYERLMKHFNISTIMKVSFFTFAVKIVGLALAPSIPIYCIVLSLQGLSYAVYVNASIYYAKEVISSADSAKGQSYITNIRLLGTIFSGFIGGRLYDVIGVQSTMLVSAAIVVIGSIIALACVKNKAESTYVTI